MINSVYFNGCYSPHITLKSLNMHNLHNYYFLFKLNIQSANTLHLDIVYYRLCKQFMCGVTVIVTFFCFFYIYIFGVTSVSLTMGDLIGNYKMMSKVPLNPSPNSLSSHLGSILSHKKGIMGALM